MDSTDVRYENMQDDCFQILEQASLEEVAVEIYGYHKNKPKSFLNNFVTVLLFNIPSLLYKKRPLKTANTVLVKKGENETFVPILKVRINDAIEDEVRYFIYQHSRYVWISENSRFEALCYTYNLSLNKLLEIDFIEKYDHDDKLKIYGANVITVEVKSYFHLLIDEIFNPFYIFQIFSIILWCFDEYVIYGMCILFLSLLSIITSLYQTKKQSLKLHELVNSSKCLSIDICKQKREVLVQIDNSIKLEYDVEMIDPEDVVPGDVIVIPQDGCVMPCDAVLISGTCIVNESMLTGESVPVTKTPPNASSELYNVEMHKRHTLFAGTHVIQTRYYNNYKVLAKVIRTGFNTSKGELVKSILYPKPIGFQFYQDSVKFLLFLSVIAIFGMSYTIYIYIQRHSTISEIIVRALDIITVVVPPALPAAMTVGTIYSQNRLRKLGIFCISPPRINVCGKLKAICFDKTGTLTHDGLEFYGVLPCEKKRFDSLTCDLADLDQHSRLIQALAACHSLTRIDGNLSGDPLDLSMFQATNWDLEEPGEENSRFDMLAPTVVKPLVNPPVSDSFDEFELPYEIGILRQYTFSSNVQCMSVICRILGSKSMVAFTKGAPEKIEQLCLPDTVPQNLSTVLADFTTSGYRVLGIAFKKLSPKLKWLDVQKLERNKVECDLNFLGLIIMQNALKLETTPIINELHNANIRSIMVTGDNVMTAISVSRDCGMVLPHENILLLSIQSNDLVENAVPKLTYRMLGALHFDDNCFLNIENLTHYHIAMDGRTWSVVNEFYINLVPLVMLYGTVFARFSPEQKAHLVMSLQELDYIVAMCGDGANDCGALKTAHIGVSLSLAEASVAAPFTSNVQNISCVKHLMLEGRCALVTSFAVFKFMAIYSFIQFFSLIMLYQKQSTLGDYQFLYIDLAIITSLAVTMAEQGPSEELGRKRPTGSLVSLMNIVPLMLQIILCGAMQFGSLIYLSLQPWYSSPAIDVDTEIVMCWDNTVIFSVSSFQYIILACVYSKGWPYRQSVVTNGYMLVAVLMLVSFSTLLLLYPVEPLATFFQLIPCSSTHHQFQFRVQILMFPLVHFLLACFIETCIADCAWLKKLCHILTCKWKPKNKYKVLQQSADLQQLLTLTSHN